MSWTVDAVMTKKVVAVRPATSYRDLVALMREHAIGAVPVVDVVDAEGRLVGIVSASDLLAKERATAARGPVGKALPERRRAHAEAAAELMTSPVVTVRPDDTLTRAARLMHRERVRHLPVVDAAGRLVGIVSRGDLLKPYLRSDESIRREIASDVLGGFMGLPPEAVDVSVADGVVTLRGEVEDSAAADLAVRLAEGVEGVVGVHDRLARRMDAAGPGTSPGPGARGLPAVEWRR